MSEMAESGTVQVPVLTLGWRLQMSLRQSTHNRQSIADQLGVDISTITRWMGDKGTPKRAFVTQWALATGVPVEWLETGAARAPDPDGTTDRYPLVAADVIDLTGATGLSREIRDSPAADDPAWHFPATGMGYAA